MVSLFPEAGRQKIGYTKCAGYAHCGRNRALQVAEAIARQRMGKSIVSEIDQAAQAMDGSTFRIKWARLDTVSTVKWARNYMQVSLVTNPLPGGLPPHMDLPTYRQRLLACPSCAAVRDTSHMQLRTKAGYRPIQCLSCHTQRWAGRWNCSCGMWWHQWCIHRVDPQSHRRMKKPAKERKQTKMLLPSGRHAPDIALETRRSTKLRRVAPGERAYPSVHLNLHVCPTLAARFPHLVGEHRIEESRVLRSSVP